MEWSEWLRKRYVFIIIGAFVLLVLWVVALLHQEYIDAEVARAYLQALTAIATIALLYYTFYTAATKREEDIARLELAVRPVLIWEIESSNGGAKFTYKTIKHPLYDFKAVLRMGGKTLEVEDRHLDVAEAHAESAQERDVSKFVREGLGREKMKKLSVSFSYHSEVGGKYEFNFTKEVLPTKKGFEFKHRKIVSAKYPWRPDPVFFEG